MLKMRKIRIGMTNLMMLNIFGAEAEKVGVEYFEEARKYLEEKLGVEVYVNLKAVTSLDEARQAWQYFEQKNVDSIILFNGTFSLSNLMTEIIRNSNAPFLIWGVEEYLVEKRLITGSMIGLMPAGSVFKNLDKKFSFIYGSVKKESIKAQLKSFLNVVRAIVYMREAKIGIIGSRPDGFEIANYDELVIKNIFGTTITKISMSYFLDLIDGVSDRETEEDVKVQEKIFDLSKVSLKKIKELSKIYIATKKVIEDNGLASYAPQCWPELRVDRKTPICPINGRITAEGIMASCEADVDCALTMLVLHVLTEGGTPWTADFVNLFEDKDVLLWWHCGNASYNISEGKPVIEVVYEGPAQTAVIKQGAVTVCRINHFRGGFGIYAGVGEVVKSKPIFKGSNALLKMSGGNMEYVKFMLKNGVPHHNVLVHRNVINELIEFANLVNLPIYIQK